MNHLESGAASTSAGTDFSEPVVVELVRPPDETSDPRQALLISVLRALDASGSEYALIHGAADTWPEVDSDVDLAFAEPPPRVLEPLLQRLAGSGAMQLVQRLHYEVPHGYYYVLRVAGEQNLFLHLDCLYDPVGINRYHLPTPLLLEGAYGTQFGRRVDQHRQALYLLMKRAIKGRLSAEGLDALRRHYSAAPQALWMEVQGWFGPEAKKLVTALLAVADPKQAEPHLKKLARAADWISATRRPSVALRRVFASSVRKLKRFRQPTGLFVVILGPDGSGKSTVTGLLLSELERAFRRTWRFHWRPSLLPKLKRASSQAAEAAPADPVVQQPAHVSKYRGLVSLARFLYYWLDFVIGYWLIIYPRKAQSTLVVGERYFPDVLVHPERYGFDVSPRLMRLAARFVPAPDLLVLLRGDPEAIFARKPELPVALIESQIRGYIEEAEHWRWHEVIDTSGGAQAVTARVASLILGECAYTTQERITSDSVRQWHVFPSARNPKIWFDDREALTDALQLYHPYSKLGQIAKAIAGFLPRWLRSLLLRAKPNHLLEERFSNLTQFICAILKDADLTVSFYMGTAGPHRKLTAQVSRDGKVISYVKIAAHEKVQQLLQREAEFLSWLKLRGFRAAEVPEVQALEMLGKELLLFLSPPPQGKANQRPYTFDYDDLRFLEEFDALERGSASVEHVLEQLGVDACARALERTHPDAASLIKRAALGVRQVLADRGVCLTASHGDFAPWNTLEVADGRLFVFDWEYAERQGVALGDLFHSVFSPLRLVTHEPPAIAVQLLLDAADTPLLARVIKQAGISSTELPAYVALYLLQQLSARPNSLAEPDGYLLESLRYTCDSLRRGARRPRVLVAAYACEPDSGSEPGVGWQMCQTISREHEVWVVTRSNNRSRIEAALERTPNPYLHFVYADLPRWARWWKRGERGIQLYYYLWQFAAWRVARRLNRAVKFDLAHHVTFVNDYTFTFLGLLDVPFVWGPIGSNGKGHAPLMSGSRAIFRDRLQYYFKASRRMLDPFLWLCITRAKLVIGNHAAVIDRLPLLLAQDRYQTHIAIGVEEAILSQLPARGDERFSVLSMGNLLPIKGFHLTLRAFAKFAQVVPTAQLTIVGEGPLRSSLEALTRELGIGDRVDFTGRLPRARALEYLNVADVFLFPSSEVAGMVILEAMAHGVPVIGLQGTGVGEMVPPACGFAVEQSTLEATVDALADRLVRLASDREAQARMRAECRRVVRERYLWEHRHEAVREWYRLAGMQDSIAAKSVG